MPKTLTIILLSILAILLPWIGFEIWKMLSPKLMVNSLLLRNIINAVVGVIMGALIFRRQIKLTVLPLILVLFVSSNVLWTINKFNTNRNDLLNNRIEYPMSIPECELESNYSDLWDYMENGCHYSMYDLIETNGIRVLVLTISLLISRILIEYLSNKKRKGRGSKVLDQDE